MSAQRAGRKRGHRLVQQVLVAGERLHLLWTTHDRGVGHDAKPGEAGGECLLDVLGAGRNRPLRVDHPVAVAITIEVIDRERLPTASCHQAIADRQRSEFLAQLVVGRIADVLDPVPPIETAGDVLIRPGPEILPIDESPGHMTGRSGSEILHRTCKPVRPHLDTIPP